MCHHHRSPYASVGTVINYHCLEKKLVFSKCQCNRNQPKCKVGNKRLSNGFYKCFTILRFREYLRRFLPRTQISHFECYVLNNILAQHILEVFLLNLNPDILSVYSGRQDTVLYPPMFLNHLYHILLTYWLLSLLAAQMSSCIVMMINYY